MNIRSAHWQIRLEIVENENPDIKPELRILSYRRLSDVNQGPFFKLKSQISALPDSVVVASVRKLPLWQEYRQSAPRNQLMTVTRVINVLRREYRTLGQVRSLSASDIFNLRRIGPESTRLACALFGIEQ